LDATTLTKNTHTKSNNTKNTHNQNSIQEIHAHIDAMDTTQESMKKTSKTPPQAYQYFFVQSSHKIFECPYCKEIITFDESKPITSKISCPRCGYNYLKPYRKRNDKKEQKEQKKTSKLSKFKAKKPFLTIKIPRIRIRKRKKFKKPVSQKPFTKKTITKSLRQTLPKPNLKQLPSQTKTFIKTNSVELLIIIAGLLFLYNPIPENIKITFTLAFIGTLLLLIPSKQQKQDFFKPHQHPHKQSIQHRFRSIKNRLTLQEQVSIALIVWTLILFIITTPQQLEIYFILLFIGILITKELTTDLLPKKTQNRLNMYIFTFLIAYIYLIAQKIMETLSTIA